MRTSTVSHPRRLPGLAVAALAITAFALAGFIGLSHHTASAASGAGHCAQVAKTAGFSKARAVKAVAIAMAESSCIDTNNHANGATRGCPHGSIDRGLWQINSCYHPEVSRSCAYDAVCNARAAYRISSAGASWSQWSTNNGPYVRWLSTARAAVNRAYGGGGGTSATWPTVRQGSTGERVASLQLLLRARGYSLGADGQFGPITKSTVRAFQSRRHLAVDGVVGPQTWSAVIVTVRPGSHGSAVVALQRQLRAHGYRLAADGDFGPKTRAAVRAFQSQHHLSVDGVVGPQTWSALLR